jgi:hypothetical protein
VGSCEAIGVYETGAEEQDGLIESLSDGSWTEIQAPVPADAQSDVAHLQALACPAVGSCEVVGDLAGGGKNGTVAEDLSGGTWTPTTPDGPSDASAIACPAIESCVAVGANTISTLSSGVWTVTTVPVPANAGIEPFPNDPNWPDATVSSWAITASPIRHTPIKRSRPSSRPSDSEACRRR